MSKKLLALGVGVGALACELAVHGYLDVVYAENRIPDGIFKRVANKIKDDTMDNFRKYTEESLKWINEQDIETIDMINCDGFKLKGYLLMAPQPSKKFILFAHGYRADHNADPANFERYYHEKGFNFMSVDHIASGESEGDFVGFDYFESRDMHLWVDYLVDRFGEDISIILHGVSMGGATVCKMASDVKPQVKAIVSDCAYTSAIEQFTCVANSVHINKTAPVFMRAFNSLNKLFAGYDLKETDVRDSVANSRVPMLFVHGSADDFVPTKMVYELYNCCNAEKDILVVDGAAHAQSVMTATQEYFSMLDEFMAKYL